MLNYNLQLDQEPVPYANEGDREKLFANQRAIAGSYLTPRLHQKNLDRPGVSRSEGSVAEASIRGANEYASRMGNALQADQQRRQSAGDVDLENALNMEAVAQSGTSLSEQDRYAELMSQLSRQQMAYDFMGGLLSGLGRGLF